MVSVYKLKKAAPGVCEIGDTELQAMLDRALAFVQTQTRHYFGSLGRVTEYLSGVGSRYLELREQAIVTDSDSEIAQVEERQYAGASPTVILASAFDLREEDNISYLVRTDGGVWKAGYEYAVEYQRGYAEDGGPKDIEDLLIELVKHKVKFLDKTGMRSEDIGGYSYTRFGESDLDAIDGAKATIAAWRRVVLA